MRMKNFIFILMLCFGCSTYALAQQHDSLPAPAGAGAQPLAVSPGGSQTEISDLTWAENLASQSVESNQLIRRINTPTDTYTGLINVKVPLYEMNTGSGTIPISLNYITTGIRVDDLSSFVGLGWELSTGGKITRVVRGQPDNFEQLKQTSDLMTWNEGTFEWYTSNEWDTEPDVYYFDIPGHSGSFVFDGNGVAHTIPKQQLKIEFNRDNSRISIHDTDGTYYLFFQADRNEWLLHWIVYPDNTEVSFTYNGEINYFIPYTTKIPNYLSSIYYKPNVSGNKVTYVKSDEKDLTSHRKLHGARLTSISCKEQEIKFNYEQYSVQNRVDSTYEYLSSINILWQGTCFRTFNFKYDTLSHTKFKLLSVYEQLKNSKEIRPICDLQYYEDARPNPDYMGFDHWGFCNSRIKNPPVCPSIAIGDFTTAAFGASRKPDLSLTRAQSLRKIIYPGGGSQEFIYDLHRGINPRTGREEDAGGLRIRQIVERTSDNAVPSIRRYEYSGGEWYSDFDNYVVRTDSSICLNNATKTIYKYNLSSRPVSSVTDFSGISVVYSDVREYLPNGSWVDYHYIPLHSYRDELPDRYHITQSGPKPAGKEIDGRSPKSIRTWCRKLLQWKRSYDSDGNVIGQEQFRYRIDTAQAVHIPAYRMYDDWYLRYYDGKGASPEHRYYVGRYEWISCNVLISEHSVQQSNTQLAEQTKYLFSPKGLLRSIYHKDAEGVVTTHTYKYPGDYGSRMIEPDTIFKTMLYRNILTPIEKATYRNGKLLNASLTTYKLTSPSVFNFQPIVVPARTYALKAMPCDSTSFTPSRLDGNGSLVDYKAAYKVVKSYDEYYGGRLICYKDEKGIYHSIIYGTSNYGRSFPNAIVTNAFHAVDIKRKLDEVYFDDFETPLSERVADAKSGTGVAKGKTSVLIPSYFRPGEYMLSYWYRTEGEQLWKHLRIPLTLTPENIGTYLILPKASDDLQIDDLSIIPRNATLESSYRIGPLGILSETDAQGHVRNYRYNSVGLPIEISDEQGNILKKYTYDPKFIQL